MNKLQTWRLTGKIKTFWPEKFGKVHDNKIWNLDFQVYSFLSNAAIEKFILDWVKIDCIFLQ